MKRVRDLKLLDTIGPIIGCPTWRIFSMEVVDGDHKLGLYPIEVLPGYCCGDMVWLTLNPNVEVEATEYAALL